MFCFFLTGVQLLEFWRHITVCFELTPRAGEGGGGLIEGAFIEKKIQKRGRLFEALRYLYRNFRESTHSQNFCNFGNHEN